MDLTKTKKKISKEIEKEYYKQADGMTIDMMDIPKVFAECENAILNGSLVTQAVRAAILMYCKTEEV